MPAGSETGVDESGGQAASRRARAPLKPRFQGVAGRRAGSFGREAE